MQYPQQIHVQHTLCTAHAFSRCSLPTLLCRTSQGGTLGNVLLDRPHGCCVHFVHFVHCSRCQCTCPGLGDASSHLRNVCVSTQIAVALTRMCWCIHVRGPPTQPRACNGSLSLPDCRSRVVAGGSQGRVSARRFDRRFCICDDQWALALHNHTVVDTILAPPLARCRGSMP